MQKHEQEQQTHLLKIPEFGIDWSLESYKRI